MSSLVSLLNNAVLLLALGVIYDNIGLQNIKRHWTREILTGLFIGSIGVTVMLNPWELQPGVHFDTRWVLISLCALFFGIIPTTIAVVMTISLRLFQGGAGMYIGTLVIIVSAAMGFIWRYWFQVNPNKMNAKSLYLMGLSVNLAVLFCISFMPHEMRYEILAAIAPHLIIIFPIGSMLLGLMLMAQRKREFIEQELIQSKRQLIQDKSLFQSIINGIPDLIFYKKPNGDYIGCNKAFSNYLDKTETQIKGKDDHALFDTRLAEFFIKKDNQLIETGEAVSNEEWVTYPSGKRVLLDTLKTPFYASDGSLLGIVGISRDITERKKTEDLLLKSESIYKNVLSSALDGFMIISMQGTIIDVNKAYAELSGYEKHELRGLNINHLDASQSRQFTLKQAQQIIQNRGERYTSCHKHKDGHLIEVEINITYWGEEGGKFFIFIKDITERIAAEKKLLQSESKFRRIFETTPTIAVQGYNKERKVIYWNKASEALYGYSSQEAMGRQLEELIIPEEMKENVINDVDHWLETGVAMPASELTLKHASGSPVTVFSSHAMITGTNDEIEMYCIDIDLSAQKKAEDQANTLSQALEQSPISVVLTNTKGVIEYVNGTFSRITGYQLDEVKGQHTRILKSGKTRKSQYQALWSAITSGQAWQGELQNKKKNGEIFWEHAHIAPVMDTNGEIKHYLAVKQDITQHKKQEEQILYQAHYDSLTGLPNRFLSLDRLAQMLKDAHRNNDKVAVLFLDIDDFKKVNDTLGHQIGDELLIQASSRLKRILRESDVVGRLGGDEFIVLLSHIEDSSDISLLAQKLLDEFRDTFIIENRELAATISIGIAIYPTDSLSPEELLRQADSAMYHSKEQGRNTYNFFTQKMNQNINRRLKVEEQLRGALQREELEVFFQPLVNISNRQVIGAEALLRWNNQQLGQVTPDEFIPLAEQTGLINAIGDYVLDSTFKATSLWQQHSKQDLKIAINVSPRQFREPNFIGNLKQKIMQYRLPSDLIELEITEGVLLSGEAEIDRALEELNQLGVSISMDDFGTGYSSLSYLRSYPFDTLKIDKSFINDITVDHSDLELVSAAIAMGHGLNLKVIAEGIETEEQYKLLAALNCDYGQGYLFGKPVPLQEFNKLLCISNLEKAPAQYEI